MEREEFDKLPRSQRFSFSRVDSFNSCHRKHFYSYVEEFKEPDNVHLIAGDIFHRLVEAYYTGQDLKPIYAEWHGHIYSGRVDLHKDLMKQTLEEYIAHYKNSDALEKIEVEMELIEEWEDEHYFLAKIDKRVFVGPLHGVRDTKTTLNKLKRDHQSTAYNPQLLLYASMVEHATKINVDFVEIDEVRLAMLEDVPINKNGKPTANIAKLGLVKYETYLYKLSSMGLDTAPEYQNALRKLEERGHPLFNRVRVQILDRNILETNLYDIKRLAEMIMEGSNARKRSILCNYCGYLQLCNLDMYRPDDASRDIAIRSLKLTKMKEEETE